MRDLEPVGGRARAQPLHATAPSLTSCDRGLVQKRPVSVQGLGRTRSSLPPSPVLAPCLPSLLISNLPMAGLSARM